MLKTLMAAAAATLLVGAASAGDKEWKAATKAQLEANAAAMVGVYEGDDMEMGPEGTMLPGKSRVEISYEGGVMKGRWDNGADGSWDGEWTETYTDGGYMMADTMYKESEVTVKSYVTDYVDATHQMKKDKFTATYKDGYKYDYVVYMKLDGDKGTRKVKARPAGTDVEWMTVFTSEFTRVAKAS